MKPDSLLCAANRLETLFPLAMSELFRGDERDPLHGLPVGQVRLVRALLAGERTGAELCESLGLSSSSLAQMVRRLVRAGIVEKRPSASDRRIRRFALTETGRNLMGRRQEIRARRASRVLARVPRTQVEALIELLEGIVESRCCAPQSEFGM